MRAMIRLVLAMLMITSGARAALADADLPAYSPYTYDLTLRAAEIYRDIAASGGWPQVPAEAAGLKLGSTGPAVLALKRRLAASDDLDPLAASSDVFDAATEEGLKRFQARHGLSLTGAVGNLTFKSLNVPVERRIAQIDATLARLAGDGFVFSGRYVVVNIPGATLEAVDGYRVARRHTAVVGRKDRQSPTLATAITAVNLLPTWTAPLSIVKKDIMPKVAADPGFLARSNMRVIGAGGVEIDPSLIDWSNRSAVNFSIRQDPGLTNALGVVRFDMPNKYAVFIHDTPKKELFRSDVRFHSSGCARISDAPDLAAWLLDDTPWTREAIKAQIDSGQRKDVKLQKPVPVAWVYLTGWGAGDGTVQFRDDVYGLDNPAGIEATTIGPASFATMASARGINLPVARPKQISWADSQ
ncbi:MAG: murein L,D-transpeptidase [Labrys sp. (in: a-proteobacteria)]